MKKLSKIFDFVGNGVLAVIGLGYYVYTFAFFIIICFIVIGILSSLLGFNFFGNKKSETELTDSSFINANLALSKNNGIEYVQPVLSEKDIAEYLNEYESITMRELVEVYPLTRLETYQKYIDNWEQRSKNTEKEEFFEMAKTVPEFVKLFPSSMESYESQKENLSNYFYKNTEDSNQTTDNQSFGAFSNAIKIIQEKGVKSENKITLKIKDKGNWVLLLDSTNNSKINALVYLEPEGSPTSTTDNQCQKGCLAI
jgi:hypothetical protein